jgi:hypothetical protein
MLQLYIVYTYITTGPAIIANNLSPLLPDRHYRPGLAIRGAGLEPASKFGLFQKW